MRNELNTGDVFRRKQGFRWVTAAVARREIDRQRKQRKRKAEGVQPRADYEAASLSQTKPWLAVGFKCRRTWERHRSRKTETVAKVSATYLKSRRDVDTFATTPSQPSHHGSGGRRSNPTGGALRRQRRASRTDDRVREEFAGRALRLAAKPSPSLRRSSYGQTAKDEVQQASLAVEMSPTEHVFLRSCSGDGGGASLSSEIWFSTLGMGSSGAGIDPQIWPLVSGSAKTESWFRKS